MTYRTLVIIEVTHQKPIPMLANMVAGRAYTIQGVTNAETFKSPTLPGTELQEQGFTLAEIALGSIEVVRT
jgi:hypothetical protein